MKIILYIKQIFIRVLYIITCNPLIKKTQWYRSLFVDYDYNIYPGNEWYRKHFERNYDIVNLGSSSAKWAFDYTNTGIKGMNWAQQPQTLLEDYNLLRHYHSILRKGGFVIITIMPFSGLNKVTGLMDALKYVRFDLQGEAIQPYMYDKACLYARFPIMFKKKAVKALIKYLFKMESKTDKYIEENVEFNQMTSTQLDNNALSFINGWKEQFKIQSLELPLTDANIQGRNYRIKLMRELIDFCIEREYKPVYVIPPVTKHLSKFYTSKFEYIYIYSFLREVDRDILTLDYSKNEELQKDELYFNSFFLNKRGRTLFTQRVLNDLELL